MHNTFYPARKLTGLLLVVLFLASQSVTAQFDSLNLTVGTQITGATKQFQPHYITSNRWGSVTDRKFDPALFLSLSNKHVLHEFSPQNTDTGFIPRTLSFDYGAVVYGNNQFNDVLLQQGYGRISFKKWAITGGRFEELVGGMDPDLSTGSLGVSGNALPIPKIGIAVTDWVNVPFINGWLRFKGTFYHGWFGKGRYLNDAFYHEKTFYMQLVFGRLKLYGGLQHFGEWGGRRGNLTLDRNFKGFWNVLLVREATDGGGLPSTIRPGRAGDQRGLVEAGADWENESIRLHLYNQTPFETGIGIDFRNIDRLAGISVERKAPTGLKRILGEFIYTKQSEGYGREVHSYYNNGNYKTGWDYKDRIIGTPLFTNRVRASKYFDTIVPYDWSAPDNTIKPNSNIVNNRVVGLNLGALYNWNNSLQTKTVITLTRNYGALETNEFSPSKDQAYLLQEFRYNPETSKWNVVLALGYDFGDLSDNAGGLLKVGYRLF
ncbi:MAG: capsule assembly Wzi family protein [Chitinophagaceae bacterium]